MLDCHCFDASCCLLYSALFHSSFSGTQILAELCFISVSFHVPTLLLPYLLKAFVLMHCFVFHLHLFKKEPCYIDLIKTCKKENGWVMMQRTDIEYYKRLTSQTKNEAE